MGLRRTEGIGDGAETTAWTQTAGSSFGSGFLWFFFGLGHLIVTKRENESEERGPNSKNE